MWLRHSGPIRVGHEYRRHGGWAYVAAWDVHRARLVGNVISKISIPAFDELVSRVMRDEPCRSARRSLRGFATCASGEPRRFWGDCLTLSNGELEFVTEVTLPGGVVEQCRWTDTVAGVPSAPGSGWVQRGDGLRRPSP